MSLLRFEDEPFLFVGRMVAALVAGVRRPGPEAAMEPGSQTAEPLSAERVDPDRPWLSSPGVARRRAQRGGA